MRDVFAQSIRCNSTYWYSSSSKYLVIFEIAVIRRSIGWFPVSCAKRRNEGRDDDTLLVDAS